MQERRYTMWWMLLAYLVVWVVSHVISDANLDQAGNMLENFAWGQQFTWGTSKHPPLIAWVAAAWFAVFPTADGSYHALAYLVSAVGLLGAYHLSIALGLPRIALPATLLLSIALPYSTLAVKFNANTVLLATWPWLAWSWVQAVQRRTLPALLLGILASLALLGKYYSVIVLLSLVLASLYTETGRRWLLSRYSVIAAFTTLLLFVPHLVWLVEHDYPTLRYIEGKG